MKSMVFVIILLAASASMVVQGFRSGRSLPRMHSSSQLQATNKPSNAQAAAAGAAMLILSQLFAPLSALALDQQYKLPPIDRKDPNRCQLVSSSMGQANAARDKLYDLRECVLTGQSAAGKDLSGLIGSEADFSGVDFKEAQISKAYARNSKFVGVDFTNAIVDRVSFDGSNLKDAVFANAVLSGTTFTDANLENTDFSDAYLGPFDLKNLCANPTLQGQNPTTKVDSRTSAGCL